MRPSGSAAIYRPDLGTALMEYVETEPMNFIGLRLMPIYMTSKNAATYPVIPKEALLKISDVSRSPRGKYSRDDWEYERGTYQTKEKGHEEPLDDSERELFDQEAPGMADLIATFRAYKKIMRAQEKRIADILHNTTNFSEHALTNEWDDYTNATPLDDVSAGIKAFILQCGMMPDALQINYNQFLNLLRCDQVVDQIKYTFPGIDINSMTSSQLAQLFKVPEVIIGGSVYDSSGKGIAANVTNIWSDEYAALVKISRGPDLTEPGLGRTFLWTEDSPDNPVVESYREEKIRSDVFRCRHHVDECLMQSKTDAGAVQSNIAAACVYLFSNVTT